ncbi:hypothetical protein, partial [Serratia marcescens]|uniref:hypothetical protein n=1 Tax=Serratia marcescens TaxID=615 RepID=UPI00237FAE28
CWIEHIKIRQLHKSMYRLDGIFTRVSSVNFIVFPVLIFITSQTMQRPIIPERLAAMSVQFISMLHVLCNCGLPHNRRYILSSRGDLFKGFLTEAD